MYDLRRKAKRMLKKAEKLQDRGETLNCIAEDLETMRSLLGKSRRALHDATYFVAPVESDDAKQLVERINRILAKIEYQIGKED